MYSSFIIIHILVVGAWNFLCVFCIGCHEMIDQLPNSEGIGESVDCSILLLYVIDKAV